MNTVAYEHSSPGLVVRPMKAARLLAWVIAAVPLLPAAYGMSWLCWHCQPWIVAAAALLMAIVIGSIGCLAVDFATSRVTLLIDGYGVRWTSRSALRERDAYLLLAWIVSVHREKLTPALRLTMANGEDHHISFPLGADPGDVAEAEQEVRAAFNRGGREQGV